MMGNKPQEEKRPRGRPRKNPLCAEANKRPRGRPRKNSNLNYAQLRDLEKQQKKEIENDKEKEKQVAEKENGEDKEEAEKENVEEKENGEDKEEAEKENVEDKEEAEKENVEEKETEEAEKEKDNEGSSESVRDGVRVSIFDSPAETKSRSRGRPRKNLHCGETKKGCRGQPRKNLNLNSAQLRDLENQKQIETDKEREVDAEEKEKEVAEKENEEEKAEAEKENEEEEKEKEKEVVDTEFAVQETIRDGVKKRGRGRPRKNLHCAEMGKRPPGWPRKNLNCAKLRDLEKQKEIENDNEREEDMEEKADEEEKEIEKQEKEIEKENVEEEEIEIEKENEEEKEKVKEGTAEFAGETKRGGVRVSIFEYSAESYFHDIDTIASVCGTVDEESFEPHVIQRFSTAITFLREWKHFYYEPKTIRCAYETGSPHEKDVNAEISLPQFSAANVPKMEKQTSDKRFGSSRC